ncbi:hybrid sensor histidine kinase/response regulator, partial [Baaleninema sp.]|uniref:hybrid sensor histidine kinase/response regulator n=1 Tax=Baaleninema sp. TaxID=3101197 RepID=UPI003CFBE471
EEFNLDFDLEESEEAEAQAEEFDLDFDLEDTQEEAQAEEFNLDFDLEESEEAEAQTEEFNLDFDLEESEETAKSDAEIGEFDLDFDLEETEDIAEDNAGVETESFDLDFELDEAESETDEFDLLTEPSEDMEELSLDDLLGENATANLTLESDESFDLDALLEESDEVLSHDLEEESEDVAEFPELAVLLSTEPEFWGDNGFDALEAYLDRPLAPQAATPQPAESASAEKTSEDEFADLNKLLLDMEPSSPSPTTPKPTRSTPKRQRSIVEQTMRVPIKQLDNLSNLVGELVVNRNSLEQDQERLRQFLDNLLHQVSQLTEVGQRMQDLYERTLLEMALLASRQNRKLAAAQAHAQAQHHEDGEYDALEMDRFTSFHEHAQEIIELVVRVRESASDIEFLVDENDQVTRQLRQITNQLREDLTRSRMVPFSQAADRLPRGVRDNSLKFGKEVDLQIEGRETSIDRMILEHLYDPLTHLVNNAIAHGIESPEERQAKGKPPTGKITVSSFHQGNQTIISIADDGAGIDVDRVKAKAIQKGLITQEQARVMNDLEVYDLLFLPGFSTKDKADDLSGRGVGMDVVKTKLNEIRGVINTDSKPNKGTTFTIRLPLTLSISKALCCISDHAPIAFPMDGVGEVLDNWPIDRIVREPDGRSFVQWRDRKVPYQPLRDLFTYNRISRRSQVYGSNSEEDTISVVVLHSAGSYLAISVDQIVGEQEIVIKQLEGPVPKPTGITGATVMGDGRIVPIADVLELIDLSMGRVRHDSGTLLWEDRTPIETVEPQLDKSEPMVLIVDDSITVRELLSMTFKKSGYRVEQARDGQEAWDKLRSGLPCELVFCDMEMPRMNGMELLEKMHNDDRLHDLPIAMLTSRTAEKMKRRAAELGARGYFTKPYLEEVLLDAAQRMLDGEVLMSSEATQEA